ncbi:MAG: hypothetical protein C0507_00635 [Cyanobacteria bacterium PR.3.49]|nr:hypothetical protein [Cyanobacteria bacterium PR.3.49]
MFDFLKRLFDNSATATAVPEENIPPEEQKKRCPKCFRKYRIKSVICDADSTLLQIIGHGQSGYMGDVIAKRANGMPWHLLCQKQIGVGSICEVFEAVDTAAKDPASAHFAVKALKSELMCDSKSGKRFLEGAKTGLALDHPNIVRCLALGLPNEQREDSKRPFMVYEYLQGKPLEQLVDKRALPSAKDTLKIAHAVCSALEYAHERDIVHADLKPTNIFFEPQSNGMVVKVSDFGCAERLFRDLEWTQVATHTTSIYGCAAYLAPEFAQSRIRTPAADIYSLGCIMYECLTGNPPFLGYNDFHIIIQHIDSPVPAFSKEFVPPALVEIVQRALAKKPEDRFQSAKEMREAIEAVSRP